MKNVILSLLLLATAAMRAQELTIPVKFLSDVKAGPEIYVGSDAFGWEYSIRDNEFRKFKDDRILKYKNLSLGEIYRVDLQNPLQIVLFYKSFNTVVLLDNQLNETARINFSNLPEPVIAEAAALASQNRLWVYDINTQQIGLYDPAPNSFLPITPPLPDGLTWYQSDYNYFYWIDTKNNCFRVNLFGGVSAVGAIPVSKQVQLLSPKDALLLRDNVLYHYNIEMQRLAKIDVVEKTVEGFYYKEQILSIFTGSKISHYKITLPN